MVRPARSTLRAVFSVWQVQTLRSAVSVSREQAEVCGRRDRGVVEQLLREMQQLRMQSEALERRCQSLESENSKLRLRVEDVSQVSTVTTLPSESSALNESGPEPRPQSWWPDRMELFSGSEVSEGETGTTSALRTSVSSTEDDAWHELRDLSQMRSGSLGRLWDRHRALDPLPEEVIEESPRPASAGPRGFSWTPPRVNSGFPKSFSKDGTDSCSSAPDGDVFTSEDPTCLVSSFTQQGVAGPSGHAVDPSASQFGARRFFSSPVVRSRSRDTPTPQVSVKPPVQPSVMHVVSLPTTPSQPSRVIRSARSPPPVDRRSTAPTVVAPAVSRQLSPVVAFRNVPATTRGKASGFTNLMSVRSGRSSPAAGILGHHVARRVVSSREIVRWVVH
mmetsp:Transcript_43132/g.91638  ORF Transcript_43132/g.91638 Transcript_43132/m.91638 type:complete len:391 (-) Transcript_43132:81-1253(-)